MSAGWKEKTIEECFKVKSGDFLPKKKMVLTGDIDVYGGNGVTGKHDQYNLTGENIIIGRVGAKCGNVNRVNEDIWITDNAFYISEFKEDFDLKFLEYLLNTRNLRETANQSAQPVISYKTIKGISLLVPPIAEQKRIVAILDEAFEGIDSAIANTEKNLANARELFESYLNEILLQESDNWEKSKLEEVCAFSQGVQVAVNLQSESIAKDKDTRFLRIVDFTQGNTEPRYIKNPGKKYIVGEDDISLVRYGASTGFVCRGLQGAIANNLFRVIPLDENLTKDYLYYFLCSPAFQNKIRLAIGGAAMPAISFGLIKNFEISLPQVFQQYQIVEQLNDLKLEIGRLETIYQQKLAALNELKQSILQKAFSGELTAEVGDAAGLGAKEVVAA